MSRGVTLCLPRGSCTLSLGLSTAVADPFLRLFLFGAARLPVFLRALHPTLSSLLLLEHLRDHSPEFPTWLPDMKNFTIVVPEETTSHGFEDLLVRTSWATADGGTVPSASP